MFPFIFIMFYNTGSIYTPTPMCVEHTYDHCCQVSKLNYEKPCIVIICLDQCECECVCVCVCVAYVPVVWPRPAPCRRSQLSAFKWWEEPGWVYMSGARLVCVYLYSCEYMRYACSLISPPFPTELKKHWEKHEDEAAWYCWLSIAK